MCWTLSMRYNSCNNKWKRVKWAISPVADEHYSSGPRSSLTWMKLVPNGFSSYYIIPMNIKNNV